MMERAMRNPSIAHVALKKRVENSVIHNNSYAIILETTLYATCVRKMQSIDLPYFEWYLLIHEMMRCRKCYVDIDAKGFDHQIPRWFIDSVIRMVGRVSGCTDPTEEEVKHLNSLRIELFGTFVRYQGGVLSSWRLTIGRNPCIRNSVQIYKVTTDDSSWLVQGDDVLLMGDELDEGKITQAVDHFGLNLMGPVRVEKSWHILTTNVWRWRNDNVIRKKSEAVILCQPMD
ncbi:hypothetical protein GCK32_022917 [Trichostrongylus colubriformis]|uniref:Uncharacterized protein n=1 Tax=Trichostrongylus colubriformis TaxID=6319 RepID=A0AAN8FRC2_TRICO